MNQSVTILIPKGQLLDRVNGPKRLEWQKASISKPSIITTTTTTTNHYYLFHSI